MAFFPKSGYLFLVFQKKGGPPSVVTSLNNHPQNKSKTETHESKTETKIHRGNKNTCINK